KLAVGEAGEGKLTSSISEAFIQFCYMYDPDTNRYSADAKRLLAFGGAAFALLLVGSTAPFWFNRSSGSGAAKAPTDEVETDSSDENS
ncbi:MAG: hypothetical protein KDK53_24590, partial [Maritimibacter sp.]|nr:hypothetical protein [Maritimibacter sp.]